jgi:predicted Zn-dependent protease
LKALLDQKPNDTALRFSYAASLLSQGLRNDAVAQIQKAIELNPAAKAQGEYYIKEIQAGRNP